MPHPVVDQLRFTREEWQRALRGVSATDATHHHGQMNSIGWIVGHLAWQEQRYLLQRPQGKLPRRDILERFFSGGPMSTPALADTYGAWKQITRAADPFLDTLTTNQLVKDLPLVTGKRSGQTLGSAIRRMTYHYWFHIGEILAIRQMLGGKRLPEYVGAIERKAPYRPDSKPRLARRSVAGSSTRLRRSGRRPARSRRAAPVRSARAARPR
jgi:hypothetical protein